MAVLTETTLQTVSVESLLDMMVERIRIQKSLHVKFDDIEYKLLKAEIKLIQAEIDKRKHRDISGSGPGYSQAGD